MNPRQNVRDRVERTNGYTPEYAPDEGGAALAIREDQPYWTERQVAALSSLGIRDATPGDLQVFMHYCLKTGLDPFARQIYLIKRRTYDRDLRDYVTRQTIQVGIDGFRVIRDRIAKERGVIVEYDGDGVTFYDAEGREHDMWLSDDPPVAGKFRLFVIVPAKKGENGQPDQPERRLPFTAKARFNAYADRKRNDDGTPGDLQGQWKTRGDHMLGKCLEALGLRMAFPQDLSGVYVEEELARDAVADGPPEGYRPDPPAARGTVREAIPGRVERPGGRRRSRPAEPEKTDAPKPASTEVAALFDQIGVAKTEDRVRAVAAIIGPDYKPGTKLTPGQETAVVAKLRECIDGATDATDPPVPEDEIRTALDCLTVIVEAAESSDSPQSGPSEPAE